MEFSTEQRTDEGNSVSDFINVRSLCIFYEMHQWDIFGVGNFVETNSLIFRMEIVEVFRAKCRKTDI